MKTKQMKKVKAPYSECVVARDFTTATCILAETQRHTKEWKSFIVEEREGFKYALVRGYRHGETGSG